MNDKRLNEIVEDYGIVLNRVAAAIPRTFQVKRGEGFGDKIETMELSATDYKDIATGILIQLAREHEREAKNKDPATPKQVSWIQDLTKQPDHIGQVVRDELKRLKKDADQLTFEEAREILDKMKAARQR